MIEFFKIECFYLPWIQKEHRYIYFCSQTPPRENWFEYERREYATAINFPCLAPRDKRVTKIDYQLKYAIFSYCVQVLYTTNQQTSVFRDI